MLNLNNTVMKQKLFFLFSLLGLVLFSACDDDDDPVADITIATTELNYSSEGSTESIVFNSVKEWRIETADSWIIVSPMSGTGGDNQINVEVAKNEEKELRTSTIKIISDDVVKEISIKQAQKDALFAAPDVIDVPAEGKEVAITVGHNIDYNINIDCDWITVQKTRTYTEDKIMFTIKPNEGTDSRKGIVTFTSNDSKLEQKVTINQAEKNVIVVTPSEDIEIPAEGKDISFTVAHNCEFNVDINCDWIKQNTTRAITKEDVSFTVSENNEAERTATITFSSKDGNIVQKINIKQLANLLNDPNEYFLPYMDALGMIYEESGAEEYELSLGHEKKDVFPGFWTFTTGKKLFFMTGYLNGWEGTVNEVILKSEKAEYIRSAQVKKWVEDMGYVYKLTRTDGDDVYKHKEKADMWLLLHYTPYGDTDFPGVQFSNMEYEYW